MGQEQIQARNGKVSPHYYSLEEPSNQNTVNELGVAVKQLHTLWCQQQTSVTGRSILVYLFVKIAFKCRLFSSPKKHSHQKENMARTQSVYHQGGKGSINLSVTICSSLLRPLLSWPLNCNMYTYYRQNLNYTGKQKQVSKQPTRNQSIKV